MDINNLRPTDTLPAVDQMVDLGQYPRPVEIPRPKRWPMLIMWLLVLAAFAGLVLVIALRVRQSSRSAASGDKAAMIQKIDLDSISAGSSLFEVDGNDKVIINGQLRANNGFVLSPSDEPGNSPRGQIYIDSSTGQLRYYNGAVFVTVASSSDIAGISAVIAGLGVQTPLPQNLSTTASPQFASLNLAGPLRLGGTIIQGAPGTNLTFTLPASNGLAGQCLSTDGAGNFGYVTCLTGTSPSVAFVQGGNSFSATATLGTTDNNSLNLISNGATRLTISATGDVGINNTFPGNKLAVNTATTADSAAQLLVSTGAAANKGLVIQGVASQSGALLQAQAQDGTVLFSIGALGTVISKSDSATALQIQNSAGTSNLLVADTNNSRIGINTGAPSADLSFGEGAGRTINVLTRTTNAIGNSLTLQAGSAGSGGSAFAGGDLVLQAGSAAGTGNAAGGNVVVRTGIPVGTGRMGYFELQDVGNLPYFRVQYNGGSANGSVVTCGFFLSNDCTYSAGAIGTGSTSTHIHLLTQNTSTASLASGNINIKTGNAAGTTANSGTITIGTGTATGTPGGVIVKNSANSATGFQIQNAAGASIVNVNSTTQQLSAVSTVSDAIVGVTSISGSYGLVGSGFTVGGGVRGAGFNGYGVFGESSTNISGFFKTGTFDGSNTSPTLVAQANTLQTANLFEAQTGAGATLLSVGADGKILAKNSADSTTAFELQNSSGTALLTADTSGMKLTVKALVVNGNLTVNGHIISGNASGTTTVAAGAAACTSPSSISISGNDTAGKVTVTTGTGCSGGGVLATISFANSYASAPYVTLTPANANSLTYGFFNGSATTTTFTIDTLNAPDGTNLIYNYFVAQ